MSGAPGFTESMSLRRDTRGVAALEFAFVAPFLILCLLAGFEITRYVNSIRRVGYVANSIAEEISQNTSGTIVPNDLYFYTNSAMVIFPGVLSDATRKGVSWMTDIQITMSGVQFTAAPHGCTSGCTYLPAVVWTGGASAAAWRSCLVPPIQAANAAPPSLQTLPVDTYGPGYLIVVDVSYTYTPLVATQIFNPWTIRRSFYMQPRYVSMIKFTGPSDPIGTACPGF